MKERSIALAVLKRFKTTNPFEICMAMRISVVFTQLNGNRGFFQRAYGSDVLYIEERLSDYEQRFVCAHELGHAFLHADSNAVYLDSRTYQVIGKYENSANRFAVYLLFPDDGELIEYADYSLEQLSGLMGMPAELVRWRYEQIIVEPYGSWE